MLGSWEDALKDADQVCLFSPSSLTINLSSQAVEADPTSPWGYERRHAALHGLQRYDQAVDMFTRMLSLIEESPDPDTRRKCCLSSTQIIF